jgi:hypothetical protein
MRYRAFAALLWLTMIAASGWAQVQTVGDVSFAVPDGWTYQGANDGGLMLLKDGANFWVISIHPPRPTTGNPAADFKAAWRSDILTIQGFQNSLPGYDPYDLGHTLGYPGKYYEGDSDNRQILIRLYTLETGKVVVPVTVMAPSRQAIDAMEHMVDAVLGSVRVAPLKASPVRNTITMADLVGEWHTGMASSRTYYDRYTGAYAGSTQTFYSARYQVGSNGSFTYEMGGMWNSRPVQDKDSGTIELGGQYVTLKGRAYTKRYRFINAQTAIDGSTVLMLLPDNEDRPGVSIKLRHEEWARDAKR